MSIFLIPARTDTKWFRKLFEANCHFSLIQGRLHFNESKSAPFPSMFVIMDKNFEEVQFMLLTKEDMREYFGI